MAYLTRKAIRVDVIARLKAAATAAGDRVEDARTAPPQDDEVLPMLAVYLLNESDTNAGGEYPPVALFKRNSRIVIDCWVDAAGADDAALQDAADIVDVVRNTLLGSQDWRRQFTLIPSVDTDIAFGKAGSRRVALGKITIIAEHFFGYGV